MGNSMGLILEARSSLFFFESVAYGKAVMMLSQKPCRRGRTPSFSYFFVSNLYDLVRSRDDIPIIESSPEMPATAWRP